MIIEITQFLLAIIFGVAVGIALGLTGGGGSIFAVPLLLYGLKFTLAQAVAASLAIVGLTALSGVFLRFKSGEIEFKPALIFAFFGMIFAPIGSIIAAKMPPTLVLAMFALLMLYLGLRMWRKKTGNSERTPCSRCENGHLQLTGKCLCVLSLAGMLAGIMAGMFGVGGGFIIVPALIMVAAMDIQRATTSSLLVIALICVAGFISKIWHGIAMPLPLVGIFALGGVLGMSAGMKLRLSLPENKVRQIFAIAIWLVAIYILLREIVFKF